MINKNIDEYLDIFVAYKDFQGVNKKTVNSLGAAIRNAVRLSKKNFFLWNSNDCREVYYAIYSLPKNLTKNKMFYGLNGKDLLEKADLLGVDRISESTAERYVRSIRNFSGWLHSQGLIKHDYFKELKPKKIGVKDNAQRIPFSEKQIKEVLRSDIFEDNHNYLKWIVLIAIEMGMRQNEISQLYRSNIVRNDGVWCIDVSCDRSDQRLKNKNAPRTIPIPKTLIKLGFIEYVESCNERLFPELKYYELDGYSRNVSKWFSGYKKQWNFGKDRDFHSFRHYFIDKMKQAKVEEFITAELVGHGYEKETYGRYGGNMSVKKVKKLMDKNSSKSVKKIVTRFRFKKLTKIISR
ncbi:hypothetical protein BCT31_13860 [Vibrio lentus]|uniref:site-specific integrase n=1 Tax=Vibrio lentus TaxID=136468 RepID=UPI000CC05B5E|nr:site-specific integrase [Vibrio lentus]PMN52652.1 hypothetical protein BCT31_13860 [Vibrio lentus]